MATPDASRLSMRTHGGVLAGVVESKQRTTSSAVAFQDARVLSGQPRALGATMFCTPAM